MAEQLTTVRYIANAKSSPVATQTQPATFTTAALTLDYLNDVLRASIGYDQRTHETIKIIVENYAVLRIAEVPADDS